MTMMGGGFGPQAMRSLRRDSSVTKERLAPGTVRRIAGYARPFTRHIAAFLTLVVAGSVIVIVNPLLMKAIIDDGITPGRSGVVVTLATVIAALAVADAAMTLAQRWFSARIGEGLIYNLRTEVFDHVQRMPVAFFTRTQTGALVSRLNSDVIGAQRALTSTLSSVVSNVVMLVLVLGAMLVLSWQITLVALVLLPLFLLPAKWIGRRMSGLTREQMQLDAEMSSMMTERFNVAGATVADHTTLAAYVVPRSPADAPTLAGDVLDYLRGRVPGHLVPSRITVVSELAYTASGKVDRAGSHRRYAPSTN
ncbi:ABC transporter transmembrane domain-containing protein [Streptosporangium algeriense]|uniref:ABC transporter transmembrane domain-containing protein n=1 Tax=Streptosporangium algeriense TaxID=1682748 RepID=A0ABW3E1X5_9ACTN